MTHATEEQLVLYHYGDAELAESAALEEHLHDCGECRARLAALQRALAVIATLPVPERSESYGSEVWARLEPKLRGAAQAAPAVAWWRRVLGIGDGPAWRPLALAGGLAALLLAAFVAGQFSPRVEPVRQATGETAGISQTDQPASVEQVRQRVLLLAVGDHLERSQMALVALVNASDGTGPVDLSGDQERVRELVAENRLYRATAWQAGEKAMATVLDELERALIEVANSPSQLSGAEFERVRDRIESQGIIFKVRVLGDRVKQREKGTVGIST